MVRSTFKALFTVVTSILLSLGNKYTFKLKLSSEQKREESEQSPSEVVKQFVSSRYPTAALVEEVPGIHLHFEISAQEIRVSELFATLCECRDTCLIDDFSLSQTTLEDIFVKMAKMESADGDAIS